LPQRMIRSVIKSVERLPSNPRLGSKARREVGCAVWDVFISHASEDKATLARPLAIALAAQGIKVWFDEFTLRAGDSLREVIDHGLAHSKYGVVIISRSFFAKQWPKRELAGLLSREEPDKVVLPVWYEIDAAEVRRHSPVLADRFALDASDGIEALVRELLRAMNLPFAGSDVTGTWIGPSGRLRLFRVGGLIEGDYDWNGRDWKAHLSGHLADKILAFEWWWDLTHERGGGFFRFEGKSLEGEWWLGQEPDGRRVKREAATLSRRSWGFRRVDHLKEHG
jgi:hypothetical protein